MKYIRTNYGVFDLSRFKFEKGDIRPKLVYDGGWHLKPNLIELPMIYSLKDYGKTWALTKKELL